MESPQSLPPLLDRRFVQRCHSESLPACLILPGPATTRSVAMGRARIAIGRRRPRRLVPLCFYPGKACEFDRGRKIVTLAGVKTTVKVALPARLKTLRTHAAGTQSNKTIFAKHK